MPTISEAVFGVPLEQLELAQVQAIFGYEEIETTTLESKAAPDGVLRAEDLSREIAAFLNMNGGILIVGGPRLVPVDPGDRRRGRRFDGNPTGHQTLTRDQIRDRLLGRIEPFPSGVTLKSLPLPAGDRLLTVVEVMQSPFPPHQVGGTYYVRIDGATRPAAHGLVQALFRGRRTPNLEIEWGSIQGPTAETEDQTIFQFTVRNTGNATAHSPVLEIFFPRVGVESLMPFRRITRPDGVILLHEFEGRPIHPHQVEGPVQLRMTGFDPGALCFEAAIFAADTTPQYQLREVRQWSPMMERFGGREARLVEDGEIPPNSRGFPYSARLREEMELD